MNIALLASNFARIDKDVTRGPELFVYTYLKAFKDDEFTFTAFASGDSNLPVKIESVHKLSSLGDETIGEKNHKLYENALISKAISLQDQFDLYHVNISCGEAILPFVPFIRKPVLVTLHSPFQINNLDRYFKDFREIANKLSYVSISNNQRLPVLGLNFIKTVYHGIDVNEFPFNEAGGEYVLWVGRGIPEKGIDVGIEAMNKTGKKSHVFVASRSKHLPWLKKVLQSASEQVVIQNDIPRHRLVQEYRGAKLFLLPIQWEEPFGLVIIEALATGTPVVAYARGSIPEIMKDGETGFLVNPSEGDIRGDWIVKKTGVEGLCEAIEKIYSLSDYEYKELRRKCRVHVEQNFRIEKEVEEYKEVYRKLYSQQHNA